MEPLALKRYQRRIADFIVGHKRCAIHADVGLGKTASTLTAIAELLDTFAVKGVMVFAPLRVMTIAWPEELRKWRQFAHLRHVVVRGTADQRQQMLRTPADIYLLNYDLMPWWVEWVRSEIKLRPLAQDMLVLDESSRLKAGTSARFKSLKPLADSRRFPRIVELTGTPAPEGYEDLWSQYRLLDGGAALHPYVTHFRQAFYDQNPYNEFDLRLKDGAAEQIQQRIAPLTVTARACDHLDLPPLVENTVHVDLPPAARVHYDEFERDMVARIDGEDVAATSAAIVSEKCRQVCSGGVYDATGKVTLLHEVKFDALDEILEGGSDHVLAVYWYKHEFDTIRRRYPTAPVLGPRMGEAEALRTVRDWNARKHRLLFMHPASVGHGINLQAGGHTLAFLTTYWSNELYRQTVGRLYRMGQPGRVVVHRIICRDTIDELVTQAVADKEFTQADLRAALRSLHNPL